MNVELVKVNGVACVTLNYPRNKGNLNTVEIDLCDVRAADSIRVVYDFDRDGWSILQASKFHWHEDDANSGDGDWQEVAFVPAWGRQKDCEECRLPKT